MNDQDKAIVRKLKAIESQYSDIEKQIMDPAIASDPNKLIPLAKEQGKLKSMVEKYRDYRDVSDQISDNQSLIDDSEVEQELRDMASAELDELEERRRSLLDEVKETLVMAEDGAIDSVIIEIRAGTGGDEASLFARDLQMMYMRYSEKNRWKVEILDFTATEMGGYREVIMNVKGSGVWSYLGYEGGGHRVQRVPETESQGRVHTSAATVAVLPEPEEVDVDINPDDVLEHVSRAGGPGGQSVNKISSAIKLEHVPTGITVSMRDEKSQHKNRAKAWRILRTRIYEHFQSQVNKEREDARKSMIGSGDRSQRIRTYNFPQNRLTDHRINLSLYSLDKVMMGELEDVVRALQDHDKRQRLDNLVNEL